ncbi:MAG: ornithine cyclodeaminase family protein [bacterium]
MSTLLLTRSDIASVIEAEALLAALRNAFIACSARSEQAMRIPVPLPADEEARGASGMILAPGLIPGVPAYSVKVHAKFPGQSPAIRGLLILHDVRTGEVLAVLESSYLTAWRTGLLAALAADVLAKPDARSVSVLGAGAQGRSVLAALRLVRPLESVCLYDTSGPAARAFAADASCRGLRVTIAKSVDEAAAAAGIVVMATWASEPFLLRRHLTPGMHVITLGADQPGKCEVSADALSAAVVVVDDRDLALDMGAPGNAGLGPESIHAELGEVLSGAKQGRTSDAEVTIFAGAGLAFQDLAAGWLVYRRARERGLGRVIDFLEEAAGVSGASG